MVDLGDLRLHFLIVFHPLNLDVSPEFGIGQFSQLDNGLGIDAELLTDHLDQFAEGQSLGHEIHLNEIRIELRLACD